jgi:hypothetical protein
MRTTTVAWRIVPDIPAEELQANIQRMNNAASNIAGELYRETINQTRNIENGLLFVTRAWPDAEKAQAWVDYVLSEGAASAQVDPE